MDWKMTVVIVATLIIFEIITIYAIFKREEIRKLFIANGYVQKQNVGESGFIWVKEQQNERE